jgi:hypothetical protein
VYVAAVKGDVFGNKLNVDVEHRTETKNWKLSYDINADLMMLGFEQTGHSLLIEVQYNDFFEFSVLHISLLSFIVRSYGI